MLGEKIIERLCDDVMHCSIELIGEPFKLPPYLLRKMCCDGRCAIPARLTVERFRRLSLGCHERRGRLRSAAGASGLNGEGGGEVSLLHLVDILQ